jgi:hypothetical protein
MTTNAHIHPPDIRTDTNPLKPARRRRAVGIGLWRFVRRFFRAQTAHREAVTLATCLWRRYYSGISPKWEPYDDTTLVVHQISNMTAGLSDQLDHAESILCSARPPLYCTPEEWETIIRGWRDRKHGLSPNIKRSHDDRP